MMETRVDAGLWPFLTLVMGLGWAMTVLIWFRQNRAPGLVSTRKTRREANVKQRLKALGQACKQQDAGACRRELLAWAALVFEDRNITGIRDVTARVPDIMAAELSKIDAVLYGGEQSAIDYDLILRLARQIMKDQAGPDPVSGDLLEPLYK